MTRILVVEDNPEDRELVRRCLAEDQDLDLVFTADGASAVEALADGSFDMVLTDLRMPRLDGLELVEYVSARHPNLPVILMTARGSEQIAVQALRAGASSYVPKHDLAEELRDTVWQVLELAETRRSRSEVLRRLERRETRYRLPTDLQLVAPLVSFVQEGLERIGFATEGVRSRVGVALMEALANAMVRGNLEIGSDLRRTDREAYDALVARRLREEPYRSRSVTLVARESPGRAEYRIADEGAGFDPATVPDPTAAENLLAVSGRGIMLMRTFMDSVAYNERGTEVTLVKRAADEAGDDPD